ncbi:transcriptional activator of sulfur metabolism Met28p [[Candida] anglica]|uniref:Transcriptional activator of sulfur metabolism Met28p n=1 Tax=[Candida] anglica TaxID=148631 RepID=A0ABP0ECN7_9ASCO
MNFQPTDYLSELNLDFELSPNVSENAGGDLDVFAHSEFFDLDVFAKDASEVNKELFVKQEQVDTSFLDFQNTHQANQAISIPTNVETVAKYPYTSPNNWSTSSVSPPSSNDDKRKKNTAASARFRIKKKQKEQEMEKKAKQLQENVSNLEKRLRTLEMENKCLKNLILQQNERKNSDLLENIKKRSINSPSVFEFTN